MPTYEYKCSQCENQFEEMSKIDDRKIPCEKPCEKCGGVVEQQIGATPLVYTPTTHGVKDGRLRDRLQQIKKFHKGSTIDV